MKKGNRLVVGILIIIVICIIIYNVTTTESYCSGCMKLVGDCGCGSCSTDPKGNTPKLCVGDGWSCAKKKEKFNGGGLVFSN